MNQQYGLISLFVFINIFHAYAVYLSMFDAE